MDNVDIRYDLKIKIADSLNNQLKRIGVSAFQLITAFIISNILLRLFTGAAAWLIGFSTNLTYNGVTVSPGNFHHWYLRNIIAVHFVPPVLCLLLGILVFGILTAFDTVKRIHIFLFWLATCLVNICLAQLLFAPLGAGGESSEFFQTFSIFGSYLHMGAGGMIFFTLVAFIGSVFWGSSVCDEVLKFTFSAQILRTQKGKNFIVLQVYVIPALLCIAPLVLLHGSTKLYHGSNIFPSLITILNLLVISLGMFFRNSVDFAVLDFEGSDVLNRVPVLEFIPAAIAWTLVFVYFR